MRIPLLWSGGDTAPALAPAPAPAPAPTNNPTTSPLADALEVTHDTPYTGAADFIERLRSLPSGPTMHIFRNIARAAFAEIEAVRYDVYNRAKLHLYRADTGEYAVHVPTYPQGRIPESFIAHLPEMRLGDCGDGLVETKTLSGPAGVVVSAAEAGASYIPEARSVLGEDAGVFASLVVEAGHVGHAEMLRDKARWWFEASKGAVRVVLLAHTDPRARTIVVEKWKLVLSSPELRPVDDRGFAGEMALPATAPRCVQTVTISRAPRAPNGVDGSEDDLGDPEQYEVVSSYGGRDIVLGFGDVYCRMPVAPERDVVFDEDFLKWLAAETWNLEAIIGE